MESTSVLGLHGNFFAVFALSELVARICLLHHLLLHHLLLHGLVVRVCLRRIELLFALFFHILTHVLVYIKLLLVGSLSVCRSFLHMHLAHLMSINVSHSIVAVVLGRGHHEGLFVEERDHTFLRQHQFNHSLSFMLVELVVLVEAVCVEGRAGARLARIDQVDAHAQARLSCVDLRLSMLAVLLAL